MSRRAPADAKEHPCGCRTWQEGEKDFISPCKQSQEAMVKQSDDPDDWCTTYIAYMTVADEDEKEIQFGSVYHD